MVKQIITDGAELKLASGLREIDEKYKHLNSGGCLFVAKWIGEGFMAKGLKVEYVILDGIPSGCEHLIKDFERYGNVEELSDLADRMLEVAHVLPIIDDCLYVDSKGVKVNIKDTKWAYLTEMGRISHETLLRWSKDRYYNWNPTFNNQHGHELYAIEKKIKSLIKSLRI